MALVTPGVAPFARALETVRGMVAQHAPLEHIEAYVEANRLLDDEERAVLWLYAWFGGEARFMARELGCAVIGVS